MHVEKQQSDLPNQGTEQFAAEAARQSQQLIEVLDTISDRVYLKDALGKVTYVNQAFLRAYDLSAADVIGKCHEDFLPPEMVASCRSADQSVLQSGEAICLETHWLHSETGTVRWSETLKSPLSDSAGNITGIVGISRDATDRRSTEEELKRQKTLLELIIETVPDEIFVKDRNRRILLANGAFYSKHDLDPEETLGQDPTGNLPADLRRVSLDSDTYILERGQPVCREISLADAEGRESYMEIRKLPLRENGEITGIVCVCRDLTEAKQAEEHSKRDESLLLHASRLSSIGELVAGIAHEVNQPLYSILNYAKAVENSLRDDTAIDVAAVRKWVQQIYKEAARGGKITQRLKSFVKRADTQHQLSDLNKVVVDSLEFLEIQARDTGLSIETKLAENLPTLMLDRIQIQQVLVNLSKNALEALQEHATASPRVLISTRLVSTGVEVSVADNGPGLSIEDKMNVLDPFQTTKHDGLGLGLAISKTIIESHQSELTYNSNEWGGVTFCFTLPAAN